MYSRSDPCRVAGRSSEPQSLFHPHHQWESDRHQHRSEPLPGSRIVQPLVRPSDPVLRAREDLPSFRDVSPSRASLSRPLVKNLRSSFLLSHSPVSLCQDYRLGRSCPGPGWGPAHAQTFVTPASHPEVDPSPERDSGPGHAVKSQGRRGDVTLRRRHGPPAGTTRPRSLFPQPTRSWWPEGNCRTGPRRVSSVTGALDAEKESSFSLRSVPVLVVVPGDEWVEPQPTPEPA